MPVTFAAMLLILFADMTTAHINYVSKRIKKPKSVQDTFTSTQGWLQKPSAKFNRLVAYNQSVTSSRRCASSQVI